MNLVAEYCFTWNRRTFHPSVGAEGVVTAADLGYTGVNPEFFPGFGFSGGIQRIGRGGGHSRRQFPIRDNHFLANWTYVAGNTL